MWAIVQPALLLAFYGVIFVRVLGVKSDRGPYLLFAWCGLAPWAFVSGAVASGTPSLLNAQALVTKVYFPREIVPLASVLVAGVDLAISTAVLLVIAVGLGVGIHLSALALAPIYLCLLLFVSSLTMLLATWTALARDIQHVLPLALQVTFVATPVMYPHSLVPGRFAWVYRANPIAVLIEQTRIAVIDGRWPPLAGLGVGIVAGTICLVASVMYVRSIEHRLPDIG